MVEFNLSGMGVCVGGGVAPESRENEPEFRENAPEMG